MATLRYKTRGGSSPQGKPRAFFFGKHEDLDLYFEEISEDILDEINCAVYYPSWIDGGSEAQKIGEFDIAQMNVIVVPVNRRLLSAEDAELDGWLDAARKNNVPILPLMQESGLDALFEKKFGSLQYLDKNKVDSTAIPYEEKLRSFLSAVMLGDELSEKIRSAFDAYIFLSYRKKDREYAQKLMKLIHENDFARDVAIWYDEFLTPGEDFNELISLALEKSSLFVLTVTPNVVNEINYIMNIEYPMAVERGKPVAPVEMVKTDESELRRLYSGIPSAVPAEDAGSLAELLRSKLSGILEGGTRDPKHRFFMGLAYLSGIDVERDAQRGMSLLKEAADEGLEEAFEKISDAYYYGDGVEQDCEEALKWRRRLDDIYGDKADKSRDDDDLYELIKRRMRYGELAYEAGVYDKALWAFDVTSEGARQLAVGSVKTNPFKKILGIASKITGRGKYYSEGMYMMIRCLRYMADIYHAMGQTDKAAECGAQAAKTGAGLGETSDSGRIYGELFMIYSRMGRMCLESGNTEGAGYWFGEMSKVFIKAPEVQTGLNEAELYTGYCLYYQARGDLDQAAKDGESAYSRLRPLYDEKRSRYLLQKMLALLLRLSDIYEALGMYGDAAACLDDAKERADKAMETGRDADLLRRYVSAVYIHRGSVLMSRGTGDPLAQLERGIGEFERMSQEDADAEAAGMVVYAFSQMARWHRTSGDDVKAMEWYEKAAVFMDDTVSFTRSIGDIKRTAEVYRQMLGSCLRTNNGALAKKYYELAEFMLTAAAKSTGSKADAEALEDLKKTLPAVQKAPSTLVPKGDLLTWIARGDKTLEEDHPQYMKDMEDGLGAICKDFWKTHRDFAGRRPVSDLGQLLRLDAAVYQRMSEKERENEKRSLCGKVTRVMLENYRPFLKYEEEANLLLAFCGLYELAESRFVISKGGKEQAFRDYGRFYYAIPFWYYPVERIKHPELWRILFHWASPFLK